jgi:hypothetical protein
MQVSRKLLVCAGLAGALAATACSRSPVAPSRADAAKTAVLGIGYGSGHAASPAGGAAGRDSVMMVASGGLGYGSGH